MSVVNKMLRDLENRKHRPQVSANYIPPNKTKPIWLGLSVLASVGIALSVYFFLPKHADQDQTIQQVPADSFTLEKGDQIAQFTSPDKLKNAVSGQASLAPNSIDDSAYEHASLASRAPEKTTEKAIFGQANNPAQLVLNANSAVINTSSHRENALEASEFKVTASDGSKSELSKLRALAHLASEQGKDEEVIMLLQQILIHDAREIRIRKQLAALLFSKSRLEEAQKTLVQGLQQAPADSSMRLMLSRIHFKTGKNEEALKILAQHPYNTLANDELLSFRAALAEKNGDYQLAQQDYQLLVQRNPLQAKWWLGLGVAQDKQKLSQEAISSYQQAQQLKQLPAQVETFVEQRIQLLARRS